MIWGMENKDVRSRAGSTRRAFLSASAVTAVAAPLLSGTALAETDPALSRQAPDPALRAMLRDIDPDRIKATILKLVSFGTRHTASSQTDPERRTIRQDFTRPSGDTITWMRLTPSSPTAAALAG